VTSSEKPGRNGQVEPDAERTTVLATAGEDVQAESTSHQSNGEVADEQEVGHHSTPPPWQRVTSDAAYARQPDEPTISTDEAYEPPTPPGGIPLGGGLGGGGPIPVPPVDRPVVTGTAAARMFGGTTQTDGFGGPPPRTTVHLDGANATTGTMRPATTAPPNVLRRPGRGPRRANLQIKRFDPWSVLKLSLVLGVALFFVWLVAVGALYAVLDGMGVWDKVNGISTDLLQGSDNASAPLISAGRVFGVAAIVGAINIVLFSALATVGAFVYNVSADLAGGLEVTLAERE
jgi:transmembrane protein DUF3566